MLRANCRNLLQTAINTECQQIVLKIALDYVRFICLTYLNFKIDNF